MKIGIIIHQHKFFGGGPRIALELAQSLKRSGHDITLYTFRHYEDDNTRHGNLAEGFPVVTLPLETNFKRRPLFGNFYMPGTSSILKYRHEIRLAKMLAARIDPQTNALIPQSSRSAMIVAYFFKQLHKKNTPVIWQVNDMVTYTFTTCHALSWKKNSCSPIERAWYGFMDKIDTKYYQAADEISVLADVIKDQVMVGMGREAKVLRVGVNTKQFDYIERMPPLKKRVRLLAHAQFFRHRRFEDAVEAVALLTKKGYDLDLTLSGDSETYKEYRDYRNYIQERAQKYGVAERVHFPGRLREDAYLRELQTADIFVFPHVRQSWGLVPFEAMATGLPVVASQEAGATEVLTDHENALVAKSQDPTDIARAIAELIDNPELYSKISRSGSTFVRNDLTWDTYAENILSLIKQHQLV